MIYNGPSIYKFGGGGGGGYSAGGELEDGDFIKIENNKIYTFTNNNRSSLNFYYDYIDGAVFNSIIELTNNTNSNVNVFYKSNDLFYPLGNIGSNSVTNGDYFIQIINDSYNVESVNNISSNPDYFYFDGNSISNAGIIKLTKIKNKFWTDYIKFSTPNDGIVREGLYYNFYSNPLFIQPWTSEGWRVPNESDVLDVVNNYNVTQYFNLGFKKLGQYYKVTSNTYIPQDVGVTSYQYVNTSPRAFGVDENGTYQRFNPVTGIYFPIRLVRDSF